MKQPQISEKMRTVLLIILLIISVAFIVFVQSGIDGNFTEQL